MIENVIIDKYNESVKEYKILKKNNGNDKIILRKTVETILKYIKTRL